MKAIIYLRTSTEEQDPENQRKQCEDFAKKVGYEVVDVFLEQISAFKKVDRPLYEKAKQMARKRQIDAVVVWSLDRWVRNRDTLLEDVMILRNFGCRIHSVREDWLEAVNIEGSLGKTIQDFLLGLIGSIAEMESEKTSERIKAAFERHKKKKKGKKWGRPSVHTNKKRVIIEHWKKGMSYREISEKTKLSTGKISQIITVHKKEMESTINNPKLKNPSLMR